MGSERLGVVGRAFQPGKRGHHPELAPFPRCCFASRTSAGKEKERVLGMDVAGTVVVAAVVGLEEEGRRGTPRKGPLEEVVGSWPVGGSGRTVQKGRKGSVVGEEVEVLLLVVAVVLVLADHPRVPR